MHPQHNDAHDVARDTVHSELLGKNAFVIAMIGAVSFIAACFSIILT